MPRSSRDEEFSAFVQTRRTGLVRSACLLTAGDTQFAEDLVQTALARLYVAWPKVRRAGTESAYDVKDLLELALSDGHAPDPGHRSDPAADLARGRRMLRRRRRRLAGLAGVTAAVLCGALVPLALHGSAGRAPAPSAAARPTQPRASTAPASPGQPHTVALVTWEGTQPPGYRVSEMPKGWVVQGSNPYALVIAPAHDPSTNPDSFVGKLVVMLQSRDATSPPAQGTPQPVNGRPAAGERAARHVRRAGRHPDPHLPDRRRPVGGHPGAGCAGLG
jgi:hypothetical protein